MSILLKNALLFDLDPIRVTTGSLFIDGGIIVTTCDQSAADEVIDCEGGVVMPGLVNGHTHLYSALAVGMPPPSAEPTNFLEILEKIWWRLDRALDAETIEMSARIGACDAAKCGTTTLIDHHASPNCIADSLDLVEAGLRSVGLRGVLCYETTNRHGKAGCAAGVSENQRFITKSRLSRQFAGLVGAHALFTLDDDSLDELVRTARQLDSGVHIHVAEDPCDEDWCRKKHAMTLIDRLAKHGLLDSRNLFAHGIHLDDRAIRMINDARVPVVHNPRSNMNNSVGYAQIQALSSTAMLGTDGIGGDMFAEAQAAWFKSRDAKSGLTPVDIIEMLNSSARMASGVLGVTLGNLLPGAAADIVITDYKPFTPMTAENAAGHFLFTMCARHVIDVLVKGNWVVRNRSVVATEAAVPEERVRNLADRLWRIMSRLPG